MVDLAFTTSSPHTGLSPAFTELPQNSLPTRSQKSFHLSFYLDRSCIYRIFFATFLNKGYELSIKFAVCQIVSVCCIRERVKKIICSGRGHPHRAYLDVTTYHDGSSSGARVLRKHARGFSLNTLSAYEFLHTYLCHFPYKSYPLYHGCNFCRVSRISWKGPRLFLYSLVRHGMFHFLTLRSCRFFTRLRLTGHFSIIASCAGHTCMLLPIIFLLQ